MTEAREWSEELVAECLELDGYLVLRNVPTTTAKGGGRNEADLVAFRRSPKNGDHTELLDIEVGAYADSKAEQAGRIARKFSRDRRRFLLNLLRARWGLRRTQYERLFVVVYWPSKASTLERDRKLLEKSGIGVVGLNTIIAAALSKIRNEEYELPRSARLLKVVQHVDWTIESEQGRRTES